MKRIIAAILLSLIVFAGCSGTPTDPEKPKTLSIEDLASLNTKVKNGETSLEETVDIYSKIVAKNIESVENEGQNLIGNAMARETLEVLKEQVNNEIENGNILKGFHFFEEMIAINVGDTDLSQQLIDKAVEKSKIAYENGDYETAYEIINYRFKHGYDHDDMDFKMEVGIKTAEKKIVEEKYEEARDILKYFESILKIEDNIILREKYLDQVTELINEIPII